jgi:hypothetical protein
MIIKATLSILRRADLTAEERREAVADIATRRPASIAIVTEVLDFAKPIKFDLRRVEHQRHLPRLGGGGKGVRIPAQVALELDSSLPRINNGIPERLRAALVNILTNARHAVHRRLTSGKPPQAWCANPAQRQWPCRDFHPRRGYRDRG